jgi:ribose 1,5-bisphosphokinase
MVVVVGPSGAGKDTLIDFAADHLRGRDNVHFVRRVITRCVTAGGESHHGVSDDEFDQQLEGGGFAISWEAHGLKYGIPAAVFERLAQGNVVIANGSRSALPQFHAAFPKLKVVNIIAQREVLAARLEKRGRETKDDILRRLERSELSVRGDFDVIDIDNSGDLADAARAFVAVLDESLK